jgi:uncharacterized membrane protein (DUF485 family)
MSIDESSTKEVTGEVDYMAIEKSPEFENLRHRQRSFVFPVLAACVVWFVVYVCLAGWATDFMSTKVFGNINWAIILGLAQIVTTFIVTTWYVSFANRRLDPLAAQIREEIEGETEATA